MTKIKMKIKSDQDLKKLRDQIVIGPTPIIYNKIDFEYKWTYLKQYLKEYKMKKQGTNEYIRDEKDRYCISMAIDDLIDLMEKIEKNGNF